MGMLVRLFVPAHSPDNGRSRVSLNPSRSSSAHVVQTGQESPSQVWNPEICSILASGIAVGKSGTASPDSVWRITAPARSCK